MTIPKIDSKWICAQEAFDNSHPNRKLATFALSSKSSGKVLGVIQWFSRWRQYAFFPENDTLFNTACLDDIAFFLKQLNIVRPKNTYRGWREVKPEGGE